MFTAAVVSQHLLVDATQAKYRKLSLPTGLVQGYVYTMDARQKRKHFRRLAAT